MRFKIGFCTLFIALTVACSNPYTPPENALDAGRQFADAIFKGNFKRAGDLLVPDPENKNLLHSRLEDAYHKRSSADRNLLSQSSLQILNVDNAAKDSVTFIRFVNSYDGKPAVLKVVKYNSAWLVDLKYTFTGNL